MQNIIDRFISYVIIDTESDPKSSTTPSTLKQWDLANKLVEELKTIGMQDVTIDENAYIMATLPSNVNHDVPTIGFISHFDTTPDFSGTNVNPQIIENYDGKDIILNKEKNVLGMMPHPERAVESILGSDDGIDIFKSMIGMA